LAQNTCTPVPFCAKSRRSVPKRPRCSPLTTLPLTATVGTTMFVEVDRRIGGLPRYYIAHERKMLVRVPDQAKNIVAFVHYRRSMAEPPRAAGTAFFAGMQDPGHSGGPAYAITARHVIERCAEKSQDGKILIRANMRGANLEFLETVVSDWTFHPTDETVDVAVLLIRAHKDERGQAGVLFGHDHFLFGPLPMGTASPEVIATEGIGPGDEVFIIGLFRNHPGRLRNIPIARIGNIAAMPGERVRTDWHDRELEAYLIEARSIGGLSGSPVFVQLGSVRPTAPGQLEVHNHRGGPHYLLGLVHGHFDVRMPDIDMDAEDVASRDQINCGIAIVVPVSKILEVLNQPKLLAERRQLYDDWARQHAATPD